MATITHKGLEISTGEVEPPEAGAPVDTLHNYYWVSSKEPHAIRRKAILKAHPEVKKLMGHEPLTKYLVTAVMALQLSLAYYFRNRGHWSLMLLVAYVVGATCTDNMFLAVHEISHNLAFKKPLHNKLFAIFVNTPVPIPYASDFGPYHQLHHKFLGDELYDTDIPTKFEAQFFTSRFGKGIYVLFQIIFYAIRPACMVTLHLSRFHVLNIVYQIAFDVLWIKYVGFRSFVYLGLSSFLAGSAHPLSGHFIAEHYLFDLEEAIEGAKLAYKGTEGLEQLLTPTQCAEIEKERPEVQFKREYALETFSYYGILNIFVWNAGLHNEHHDFPFIPWTRVWELHRIAPEFYLPLPRHTSWVKAIWDFVFRSDLTFYNRVKRPNPDITKARAMATANAEIDPKTHKVD